MDDAPGGGPRLHLNNGVLMPQLGLGVWQTAPEETAAIVERAIREGYRLIDTASMYGNEEGVGRGIAASGVDRREIFVTTKLWITEYSYAKAIRACEESLRRLGLDAVDLYLLHWPAPGDGDASFDAWQALERLLAAGRARSIGISNHTPELLAKFLARVEVTPAVHQMEVHPYFSQPAMRAANAAHGIVTQSWSPIGGMSGSGGSRGSRPGRRLLEEPLLLELGRKHGRSTAQIVLRWHFQHGLSAIPKTSNPKRLAENLRIFDFALAASEMAAIDALDTGLRGGSDPFRVNAGT